jgi:histidinol dehydrogenase
MLSLHHSAKNFSEVLTSFCRGAVVPREIADAVASILADVRNRGDEAVGYYAAKFDGAKLRGRDFRVPAAQIAAASKRLPPAERRALQAAHDTIADFNRRELPKNWTAKNKHGAMVGEKFDPIRRVGLYVPGGQVPLVSTVLMTATLAKIAGCPEIAVLTPSNPEGKVADGLLAALDLVGVDEVYRVGGVQAVGAMAYGTTTIPAVDKIFGPGNAYVCEAKRQVFGTVGVDSLPGPSEVMIIADETAKPAFVAADLLAQAEHGSGREKSICWRLPPKSSGRLSASCGRSSSCCRAPRRPSGCCRMASWPWR